MRNKAQVFDSSCSAEVKILYINKDNGYFLKIAGEGQLKDEVIMTDYFYNKGLSTKVNKYLTEQGNDYLVTNKIKGEDGIFPKYLDSPEKLCDILSESLLMLPNVDFKDCPKKNRTLEMINLAKDQYKEKRADIELLKYLGTSDIDEAYDIMCRLEINYQDDVLLHGDYCLPNILLDKFKFSGFVDVGYGGIGDRHYDIFWGIWSLNYNLKTDKHKNRFLDAYGRDKVDDDRLLLCGIISALTGG